MLFGHIEKRVIYVAIVGRKEENLVIYGKRRRGRPMLRLRDKVQKDLKLKKVEERGCLEQGGVEGED